MFSFMTSQLVIHFLNFFIIIIIIITIIIITPGRRRKIRRRIRKRSPHNLWMQEVSIGIREKVINSKEWIDREEWRRITKH